MPYSVWNSNTKSIDGTVVVAMVQSARGLAQALKDAGKSCKVLVIDEAHHRPATSYQNVEQALAPDFVLCLTATPTRMDDKDLGIDKISYEIGFLDLVRMGYLAKPKYIHYQTGLDVKLRSRDGEFSRDDLSALGTNEVRNKIIAKDYAANADSYGKTIVFCTDIEHCIALRAAFDTYNPGTVCDLIHSGISPSERAGVIKRFSEGTTQVLFNVSVLTEGFDVPDIKTVILARPTKSESLWAQMVGRGSRPHPTKSYFNIVDFVDSGNNYGLLSEDWSVRLLGVEENPDAKKRKLEALTVDKAKEWLKDVGYTGKLPKEKREVVDIDGVLVIRTKGKTTNFLVKKRHRKRLEGLIKHIRTKPPGSNADIKQYLHAYANNYNKSLMQWPGRYHLVSIGWAAYFRFVLNRKTGTGLDCLEYKTIPDFSYEKTELKR